MNRLLRGVATKGTSLNFFALKIFVNYDIEKIKDW